MNQREAYEQTTQAKMAAFAKAVNTAWSAVAEAAGERLRPFVEAAQRRK